MRIRLLTCAIPALAAALPGGCRSYEPRPLDTAATREAWRARTPADEPVRQLAARLAAGAPAPAPFDPSDGLSLAEAEAVALVFNPGLRVARREAGVTAASAAHAGRWEDPVAGIDLERILSGVSDPWVIAGAVGLTLPISGRLAVEKDLAGAEHTAALRRLAAMEWATRAALRELWIEWSAQAERARAAEALAGRLGAVAGLAQRQEEAGVLSRIDARVFGVERAGSEADLIAARARQRELELQVRALLGLAPGAPVALIQTLAFEGRAAPGAEAGRAMEAGNAELAAARGEYDAAEQALRLEVRKQYPDLAIGPGYGTDQGDERLLLGLRLPVPLWNANRQGVAQAEARREAARERFEAAYAQLDSRLAVAQTRAEAGRAVREAVEARVLPLAEEQDAQVQRLAELGRVDPLLFLQAIRAQHDAKVRLIDARAAEAVGAIRLDELIGPPPRPPADPPPQPDTPDATGGRP